MLADPDAHLRRDLARHKAFATGLLVLMAGLVGLSLAVPHGFWSDLLQASAKAGFVGGIADWLPLSTAFTVAGEDKYEVICHASLRRVFLLT